MKILKIKTPSGFKMLEPNFEINFMTKTRVDLESPNDDLIELEKGLFYPVETVFIGKNSSGKTTTLDLIAAVFELLNTGRISKRYLELGSALSLEVLFYTRGSIFRYTGEFRNNALADQQYLTIEEEGFGKTTLKASYKKDLSNAAFLNVPDFVPAPGGDTSFVTKYASDASINLPLTIAEGMGANFRLFHQWLGEDIFNVLVRLFDDSIEVLTPCKGDAALGNSFLFRRVGEASPIIVDALTLERLLSKGTVRGIILYALSLLVFRNGGHLLVDEIEASFNRNLIENLFLMFEDPSINKNGGSIIYSTHYSELLDVNSRCDNVNVLHRNGTKITLRNMSVDYNVRTEMLKSSQFNQNTFDTLINYNRLMDLKDAVRKG